MVALAVHVITEIAAFNIFKAQLGYYYMFLPTFDDVWSSWWEGG